MDREAYINECKNRWHGAALQDARRNWNRWEELRSQLLDSMRDFKRNPTLFDGRKHHNPDGTLTAYLWKLQDAYQADKSRLDPFIDFEEHFQKVFLRRGLVIYCTGLLREIETPEPTPKGQLMLL